ncbi:hypothetical protein HC891_11770 [Candidatus Gracilibacteria bacterium]|nr:hypothetical protein [Candidatus Gracilibacteria bacterium]
MKLVAARLSNRNVIEFRNEIGDVERERAELTLDDNGGLANIAALDLTISADPATRELRASYRKELISGGVESKSFSLGIEVPTANAASYFNSASQAGLTFSARGPTIFKPAFASTVLRGYKHRVLRQPRRPPGRRAIRPRRPQHSLLARRARRRQRRARARAQARALHAAPQPARPPRLQPARARPPRLQPARLPHRQPARAPHAAPHKSMRHLGAANHA